MRDTIKTAPTATERAALAAAQAAADAAQDEALAAANATATMHVYDEVREAAQAAYDAAGGGRQIVVRGHGNTTHPVISVSVRILRTR
jgi:hypothetical protein